MTARNNWTGSISAFAVGVGVGAALGVLFAPRSGNDTRECLLESAQEHLDGAIAAEGCTCGATGAGRATVWGLALS